MDNSNKNEASPNILSGHEEEAHGHDLAHKNKEHSDLHKNKHLDGTENAEQNQEKAECRDSSKHENENDDGKRLLVSYEVLIFLLAFPLIDFIFVLSHFLKYFRFYTRH